MFIEQDNIINNQYKIIEKHNYGGMGKTYIAQDLSNNKKVILKVLVFREMENWKVLDLFEREVKTLSNLNHPHIPDYIDHFEIEESENIYYFLVQEYVE